jgi:hypothetical protein
MHGAHIRAIATSPPHERNLILRNASPQLVEALATAIRLLDEQGMKFAPQHQRRARRMMSRNTAKRTKKELVSGKEGATSRGGGFFGDVGNALMNAAPALLAMV